MTGTSYIVEAASAVASVMTMGAGSPLLIAAVALSAAALVVENTNCFGKFTPYISAALEVASAVCSIGSSIGSSAASAGANAAASTATDATSDAASNAVSAGVNAASSTATNAAAAGANTTLQSLTKFVNDIKGLADLLQATAQVGTSVVNYQTTNMQIDEKHSQQISDRISVYLSDVIDDVKQSTKDSQALQTQGNDALNTYNSIPYIVA